MSDLSRECEPKRTSADADLARTLAGSLQRGVQLWRDAEHLAELRDHQSRRDVRLGLARFHFAPSKNCPAQQPVERDIAKEAALRRLGPP